VTIVHTGVDIRIPVEDVTGIEGAEIATTVWEPTDRTASSVVCVGSPGGGYARGYFAMSLPGRETDGQAGYHVERGWTFVAIDHLGVGESTVPPGSLSYETVAAAGHTALTRLLERLELRDRTLIGIGQSMGGGFLIVQQAHHRTFDAIAVLGASAIHTVVPTRPGTPPLAFPWIARTTAESSQPVVLNSQVLEPGLTASGDASPLAWAFHFDDEPPGIVAQDMAADRLPPWRSPTVPSCAVLGIVPGQVASEAASIAVPVFVGTGERDVVPDPSLEPFAYRSATDITVFVCPGMAHMHNFATTRHRLWERLHHWGEGVARVRRSGEPRPPQGP
jgi:pimeloyl-ACP methyl ester carboxylesterase